MTTRKITRVHFRLGQIVMTNGVAHTFKPFEHSNCLSRHAQCDWGNCCEDDWKLNDHAVTHDERIMSIYRFPDMRCLWIVTEADRSTTTLLLPEEY